MIRPYHRTSDIKEVLTRVTMWINTRDLKGAGRKGQMLCPGIGSPESDQTHREGEASTDCVSAGFLLLWPKYLTRQLNEGEGFVLI